MDGQKGGSSSNIFPSELVSPEEKSSKKHGLELARAIYHTNASSGSSLYYNDRDLYRVYVEYALGEQEEEQYKPQLGINSNNIKESMLPPLNWQIRNYALKRLNVVKDKVTSREYDPVVSAIDQKANDFKEDYKARVKHYIRDKAWIQAIGEQIGADFTPPGIDLNNIPLNDEEVELNAVANHKLRSELELEMGIKYHLERNNYNEIRENLAFDIFSLGLCAIWIGMDENNVPIITRYRPEDILAPYTELPNFDNINYCASINRWTISELKKFVGDEFTDAEYKEIEEKFMGASDREVNTGFYNENNYYTDRRDTKKIRIIHFEFLTTDQLVHVDKKDNSGNQWFNRKGHDFYPTEKEQAKFEKKHKGDRKIKRTEYQTVYSGYWIQGSKYLFKYGRKKAELRRRGNLGETMLGYKLYAPNIYNGRVVSTVKQMIPLLDDLQLYHLKLQQTVASAIPKGIQIDIHQIAKVKFKGNSKKDMTPKELLEMYFQTGMLLVNTGGKQHRGDTNKPIVELDNGMSADAVRYMELIEHSLTRLDEIIGTNPAMLGSNLHQDTGKAVAEMQIASSESAINFMYRADKYILNEMCKTLGLLHVHSVKFLGGKKYDKIIGSSSRRFIIEDSGIDNHDFGYSLKERPDPEEWNSFYQALEIGMQANQIGIDDYAAIKEIENLKEAKLQLKVAVNKQKAFMMQEKEALARFNGEEQRASNEQAHKNSIALEDTKMNTIIAQGEQERETMRLKFKLEGENNLSLGGQKGYYKLQETDMITKSHEERDVLKSVTASDIAENKNNQQNK